jgi:hypothetical protein
MGGVIVTMGIPKDMGVAALDFAVGKVGHGAGPEGT